MHAQPSDWELLFQPGSRQQESAQQISLIPVLFATVIILAGIVLGVWLL